MDNIASTKPVCVFDSGIGGLNLLRECVKRLPHTDFVYVADNYNVPYGGKNREEILSLALNAFKIIDGLKPAAAVVACNTVTAACIEELRSGRAYPVLGIQPAVKPAAGEGRRCAVLATPSTVKSGALARLIDMYGGAHTQAYACDGLAEFIEKSAPYFPSELPEELLPKLSADCIVLGCTHYAFVKNAIRKRYGCRIFDGMIGTADHLRTLIGFFDHNGVKRGKIDFICGDFVKNRLVYNLLCASEE